MFLHYFKDTKHWTDDNGEDCCWGHDFEYEIDWQDIVNGVAQIITKDKATREQAIKILSLLELDVIEDIGEYYEDELTELFREEAFESVE